MTARKAIIEHLASGVVVTPDDLATHAGVSTAYAKRLVDRMVLAGQLIAWPHGVALAEGQPSPRRTLPSLRLRQRVIDLLTASPEPMVAAGIAMELGTTQRHARRVLADLEALGLVSRSGPWWSNV